MKKLEMTLIAGLIAGMSGVAYAGGDDAVEDDMTRRAAGTTSGSGDTVVGNCGDDGNAWQGATAELEIEQSGTGSEVNIEVKGAVPNTHFTVWMRVKGGTGFNDAGSPWTGGGATPLCSGTEFADLNANSPWNNADGSEDALCNSFVTDANGNADFETDLNFAVVGGAYPFQQSDGASARPGHDAHADVPTAIVDPRTGNGGPFMIRVISHCTDNANHGLSPYVREAWFQYP